LPKLLGKVTAVSGILEPIPGYRLFRILGFAAPNVSESIIDPRLQKVEAFANYHVIIIGDRQQRVPVGKNPGLSPTSIMFSGPAFFRRE
jgi:hypothetical protein